MSSSTTSLPWLCACSMPCLGNFDGVALPLFKDRDIQLPADNLQLTDGRRTVDVAGHQQRALALLLQITRQLAAVGRLARALQTHQHDDRGRLGREVQLLGLAAHQSDELFVDNLDNHLRRGQGLQHVAANGTLRHALDEILDDLVADVRLQQCQADFPHGVLDVGLAQAALAAQALERRIEFFRQSFERHRGTS